MSARPFTHPNFGHEVRVEQQGREVRLIFVAATFEKAGDMADHLLSQLKAGALNVTLMGRPTGVEEETR